MFPETAVLMAVDPHGKTDGLAGLPTVAPSRGSCRAHPPAPPSGGAGDVAPGSFRMGMAGSQVGPVPGMIGG